MTTTSPFPLYTCDDYQGERRPHDIGRLVVTVLDPDTGKIVTGRGVQGRLSGPVTVIVHPDGRRLCFPVGDGEEDRAGLHTTERPGSVAQVVVVDSHDLRMIANIDVPGRIDALAFSPDGTRLYIMCARDFSLVTAEERADPGQINRQDTGTGLVTEVDTATSLPLRSFRNVCGDSPEGRDERHTLAVSADGTRLYIGDFTPDHTEAGVRILDLATGTLGDLVEFTGEGGGPDDFLLLAHPDGSRLYAAHRVAGTFAALDPDTLQVLARFEDHPREEERVSDRSRTPGEFRLSPDGRHLYTNNSDGRGAQILDAVTLAPVAALSEDFVSQQLSVLPDGRLGADTSGEGFVLVDPHNPGTGPVPLDTDFRITTVTAAAPTTHSTPIPRRGAHARFKHAAASLRQDGTKELLPHTQHTEGEQVPEIGGNVVEGHYARDTDGAWRPAPWPTGSNKTFLEVKAWGNTQTQDDYVFFYIDSDDITWN